MSQFYSEKWPRKNGLQNGPKMHFLLSLILPRFPPKRAKCAVSARKGRQQIGLKAYIYIHTYVYLWARSMNGGNAEEASQKSPSIAKNHPEPSQEFSEQFGPFIHKLKGLVGIRPKMFTQTSPKTREDKFLGVPSLASMTFSPYRVREPIRRGKNPPKKEQISNAHKKTPT